MTTRPGERLGARPGDRLGARASDHARRLRLGTRGSDLALTQSGTIADALRAVGHEVELTIIRTEGDRSTAPSFGSIGALGVFVREIELALLNDEIDLAVHSFKDLPTTSPEGLTIAAIPPRVDAADVLILREREQNDEILPLAQGARVGTSSVRRGVWLRHFRPDLAVEPLRGNVPTRIQKLRDGQYDAIVLAAAGVARLVAGGATLEAPLADLGVIRLDPRQFVAAPAQGALAVQCRSDREDLLEALAALDDAATRAAVTIERDALRRAEGGCNTAFGAYCEADGHGGYDLTAMLERSGRVFRVDVRGDTPESVGANLWRGIDSLEGKS